ncbi:hypothetical protein K2X05_06990 [bacterium]|nr:hypothetical protein [bacterium]
MKNYYFLLVGFVFCISCSSSPQKSSSSEELKIIIHTGDVIVEGPNIQIPLKISCVEGYKSAVVQIGDMYKTFECGSTGKFEYIHMFPKEQMKENREKKKDYVLRIRVFHEEKKDKTLTQSLVIVSYKDYQAKLEVNQGIMTMKNMDGVFSDLEAHGQCVEGSTVELEVFDDFRGVSLEEDTIACGETGFHFATRKPGVMKKGMRLLIRQMKNEKAISSYEVVLFN